MYYNFDQTPDLRSVHAIKWTAVPDDVLPLWVADMDFMSAQPIIDAIVQRAQFGTFGYTMDFPPLREALVERMKNLYDWDIKAEWIMFIPGMVTTMNMITRTFGKAGDGVIMQTPVYHPFLLMPQHNGRFAQMVDLVYQNTSEHTFTYTQDLEAFERAITKQTSLFYLCNPHNPTGLVYTRQELETLAQICLRNKVMIVADEIHSDLILEGKHTPIASLSPEVAEQTITLIAPSKTYNLAGLGCSIAIVPNDATRKSLMEMVWGTGLHVDLLALNATHAAYTQGQEWLEQVLVYLKGNRDFLVGYIGENIPQLKTTVPHGTYLAYLDGTNVTTPNNMPVHQFLLEQAKVALNAGNPFHNVNAGSGRDNFVRLNFATSRQRLTEALGRIEQAVK
jgi:cysteine-S-conjugate beta-lyase